MPNSNDVTTMANSTANKATHRAACRCGTIQIEVDLDLSQGATRCNCSICHRLNSAGAIVKPEDLRVLTDETTFSTYTWGYHVSTRYFCPRCGVHVFGRGHLAELGGDFASVNLQCLETVDVNELPIRFWDGRHNNWEGGMRSQPWPIFSAAADHAAR